MELMSDSEKEIMKLIWDHGGAMTISELQVLLFNFSLILPFAKSSELSLCSLLSLIFPLGIRRIKNPAQATKPQSGFIMISI